MAVLSAQTIRKRILITPFSEAKQWRGLSYGLSAASYDIRLGKLQPWKGTSNKVPQERHLPSGHFVLASSLERIELPDDITGMVHDKSTLARKGLALQNTFIDPGFRGWVTLEIANHGPDPILLSVGMPIAQIVFHELDLPTELPYDGKYQDQPDMPVEAIEATDEDLRRPKKPLI